jgi:hypothetical protein
MTELLLYLVKNISLGAGFCKLAYFVNSKFANSEFREKKIALPKEDISTFILFNT